MKRTKAAARKILVSVIGFPIIIIGVILVPLPGPGLLIMFLGLFIVSREFTWAEKYFDKARDQLVSIFKNAKERADKVAGDSKD